MKTLRNRIFEIFPLYSAAVVLPAAALTIVLFAMSGGDRLGTIARAAIVFMFFYALYSVLVKFTRSILSSKLISTMAGFIGILPLINFLSMFDRRRK